MRDFSSLKAAAPSDLESVWWESAREGFGEDVEVMGEVIVGFGGGAGADAEFAAEGWVFGQSRQGLV